MCRLLTIFGVFASMLLGQIASMPDTVAFAGGSVSIPVVITDVVDLEGLEFTVQFDETVLTVTSTSFENTNLEGMNFNATVGTDNVGEIRVVAFAGGSLYTGSGTVIFAHFDVIGELFESTDLTFTSIEINNVSILTNAQNGSVVILQSGCMDVSACNYDASAKYDDGSCAYESDCFDVCGGSAVVDCAGDCGGQALEDCNSECNGSATVDECGVCDADSTNDCVQDCNDEWGGSAEYDDCTNPVCAGGSTGLIANDTCTDCNGEVNGSATYDECGVCNGSGPSGECGCNDILDGYCDCDENILDECGFCGGDNSTCLDCSGTANGEAQKDMCGVCDSDITNDCIQDCNDEWGGSAEYDDCINPVCAGGSTGLIANATCTDCNGDVNGSAIIDCSGECDGIAFSDMCGTCDTDSTNDCTLDCTGEWGGSLVNDDCGWCGGDGCHGGDCETYPADKYDCDGVLLANDLFAPFEFKLLPNYPNPFNPSTTINYSVAIYSEVNISIYSMAGELVQTLVNTTQQPGQYAIQWNASNFPSGLYFVKLNSNNKIAEQKVLLIK